MELLLVTHRHFNYLASIYLMDLLHLILFKDGTSYASRFPLTQTTRQVCFPVIKVIVTLGSVKFGSRPQ